MQFQKQHLHDRSQLQTERRLPASMQLDRLSLIDALAVMNEQDCAAVMAVASQRDAIARAIGLVVQALSNGGRLIYAGAGTSGRLGILDATECPPTFGTLPEMVQGVIAGGEGAVFRSVEGAEDSAPDGAAAMDARQISARDVVMGIAAGGTTPFVRGALERAAQLGAKTVFLCCVEKTDREPAADVIIRPITGPEVLTGSTRLKAGTATKLVLNQVTTLAMVGLGKVYENLMVDLRATNEKLRDRAIRIVSTLTERSRDEATQLLEKAGGDVKLAIVMHRRALDPERARQLLALSGGILRKALEGQ